VRYRTNDREMGRQRRAEFRTPEGQRLKELTILPAARVLSVGLRSRGSIAGLNGRTTTRAGSGVDEVRACRRTCFASTSLSSLPGGR
jgi:hypothetical protein